MICLSASTRSARQACQTQWINRKGKQRRDDVSPVSRAFVGPYKERRKPRVDRTNHKFLVLHLDVHRLDLRLFSGKSVVRHDVRLLRGGTDGIRISLKEAKHIPRGSHFTDRHRKNAWVTSRVYWTCPKFLRNNEMSSERLELYMRPPNAFGG